MNEENDKIEEEQTETAVAEPEPEVASASDAPIVEETRPAPQVTAVDPTFERRAVRRGCFSIIFGAVFGAIIGAALTLSLLSWLNNGTLTYNQASVQLHNELDDAIATRQVSLDEQSALMDDLLTRQAEAEATMAVAVNEVEAGMATSEAEVAKMRVTAVYLETRIGQAGNAADTLDAFLDGLDELVSDVDMTPTPVP